MSMCFGCCLIVFANVFHDRPIFEKIARDVLRDVAANYNATQFFDNRKEIGASMKEELTTRLAEVKGTIGFLQLRSIDLPDAYENIIEQKEIVRQQIQKAQYDREAATVVAETNVLLSEKTAQVQIINAQASAQAVVVQADATANSTRVRVKAESEAYSGLSGSLGFNSTELLSYLWIQAVQAHTSSQLIINLDKPAVLNIDEP
jgi:regulator of protease activity HflC (stomatin/prohibitin superfamily)